MVSISVGPLKADKSRDTSGVRGARSQGSRSYRTRYACARALTRAFGMHRVSVSLVLDRVVARGIAAEMRGSEGRRRVDD